MTPLDETLVLRHSIQLKNLLPDTQYRFVVMSVDLNGNLAVSAEYQFTTTAGVSQINIGGEVSLNSGNESSGQPPAPADITSPVTTTVAPPPQDTTSLDSENTVSPSPGPALQLDVSGPDSQSPAVDPQSIEIKEVSWSTLGIIIGSALIVIAILVIIVLYWKRQMLREQSGEPK